MYKIKEKPEDFEVEEITNIAPKEKGKYSLWWMTKTNYTTQDAISKIAKKLRTKERLIGFAGTKDKKAVTKQLISVAYTPKHRIKTLSLQDISLEFYGFSENPVSLGDLEGNSFKIIIRNLDEIPDIENKQVKNFYGEQRFSKQNAEIGKLIIKRDFKKAAEMIAETEDKVKEYLEENKTDYVGALRKLQIKVLKLYAHSYQSYMWNKTAEKAEEDKEIPIIGFDTETEDAKMKEMMKEEGITYRDFIIKQIPELSSEGGKRELFVKPTNFSITEKGEDELNENKKKIKLEFSLPKGSYATEVIRQLFS